MVVGICRMRLLLHGVFSLKEKRGIVRRIIGRTRSKFEISIAEVAENDNLQSAVIGFSLVGNDRSFINSGIDKVKNHIENLYLAEIIDCRFEIIHFNADL